MHTETGEAIAQTVGDFPIEKRKEPIAAIDQCYLNSESHKDRCIFAADDTPAYHRETLGNAIHLKKSVGIERVDVVEGNFRGTMRLGTRGDKNDSAAQRARAGCAANGDGVCILETGLAANQLDLVKVEILEDASSLHLDDFAFVVHEVVDGEIFLERVVDAVEAALLQAGEIERRLA